VEEVSVVSSQPKPSLLSKLPKFTTKTLALAGGGAVVAIVAIVLLVVGLARPMPTRADAADFMIKKSDFSGFSLKSSTDPSSLGDGDTFFVSYSGCDARSDSIDAASSASTWENVGFINKSAADQYFSVSQTIYEFDTESDVEDFIATISDGVEDSDCDSDNIDDQYDDQGSIQENFGVDLPGFYAYNSYGSGSDVGLVIVVRGLVVSEYQFHLDDEDSGDRKSDIEGYLTTSIERFAGIRRD
ncbi:MAG: hypothetical protein RJA30_693, partial [Actinomycetota bacterium]